MTSISRDKKSGPARCARPPRCTPPRAEESQITVRALRDRLFFPRRFPPAARRRQRGSVRRARRRQCRSLSGRQRHDTAAIGSTSNLDALMFKPIDDDRLVGYASPSAADLHPPFGLITLGVRSCPVTRMLPWAARLEVSQPIARRSRRWANTRRSQTKPCCFIQRWA
jgi:hypothetical protein